MYEGRRAQSPFDGSADDRLRWMGLTDVNGNPDRDATAIYRCIFAGQFFDDLCDYFESCEDVRELTRRLLLAFSNVGTIPRMSSKDIDHYSEPALFHDIGKQAIPPAILNKPGALTTERFSAMKAHTINDCRLPAEAPALSAWEDFLQICDVCRHHHERWDGGDYPDGPFGCRIAPWVQVAGLADAFDALLRSRVYKQAYLWTQAASMIEAGACGAFSPDILLCFCYNISRIYATIY